MSKNHRWRALFPILRATKNMTAKEVYKKTKGRVSLSTIRNWKTGRVSRPKFETMQIVLISLGYTFDIVSNTAVTTISMTAALNEINEKAGNQYTIQV